MYYCEDQTCNWIGREDELVTFRKSNDGFCPDCGGSVAEHEGCVVVDVRERPEE